MIKFIKNIFKKPLTLKETLMLNSNSIDWR